jgi:deoxycytidylate deaminase
MKFLSENETKDAEHWFNEAARVARQATCLKARCGSVIVKGDEIIGEGYNGPPLDDEASRTCPQEYTQSLKPLFDKTCCVHAEWCAVLDACKRNPSKIAGSRLYFMRVNETGELTKAGDPYCTVCSRLTMEAGVAEFALWQKDGMAVWPLDEYNRESYAFFTKESRARNLTN